MGHSSRRKVGWRSANHPLYRQGGIRIGKGWIVLMLLTLAFWAGCDPSSKEPAKSSSNSTSSSTSAPLATKDSTTAGDPTKKPKPSSLRAQKLWEGGKTEEAWEECQKVLLADKNDYRAMIVASQVLRKRNKLDAALKMLERIDPKNRDYGPPALKLGMNWALQDRDMAATESWGLRALAVSPRDPDILTALMQSYDLQGRRYEAAQMARGLVYTGKYNIITLVLALDAVKPVDSEAEANKALAIRPTEMVLHGAAAFGRLHDKQPELAEQLFRKILATPDVPVAFHVGLGQSLIEQEKWDAIPDWLGSLNRANAERLPSFWRIIGMYFQFQGKHSDAVYALTRGAELDPTDYVMYGALSQALAADGQLERAELAESVFDRQQLTNRNANYVRDGFRRPEYMLQIADTLDAMQRPVEAIAWREQYELANDKDAAKIEQYQNARREAAAKSIEPKTLLSWSSRDLKQIEWNQLAIQSKVNTTENPTGLSEWPVKEQSASAAGSVIRFADRAKELGIDFQYDNGDDPKQLGMQIYQSNGGGASAIDFDNDGWPDLFATQAGGDPRQPTTNRPSVLYRNVAGTSFQEVALSAHCQQRAYGQSAVVGDWNQDGFQDLFLLNFGQNLLLQNRGDGTFEQIDAPEMRRDVQKNPDWSVSGAIADLNGDHLPDLVEVNYTAGIEAIVHECLNSDKVVQVCRPTELPASLDRIYLNSGDGNFRLINQAWDLKLDEGRGLGVIVANLDQKAGNDVYVANDMSANYYLVSQVAGDSSFRLRDEAVRRGCAVDVQGKPQASMGVACADFDRNGRLDLFMTNFYNEYNALFLQNDRGAFTDASRRYRSTEANKTTLGFGTQAVDLDRDGWFDAIIVNGHVDDYSKTGKPYKMKPQILMQRSRAFDEIDTSMVGEYFQQACLARALGMFDFNKDGNIDFFVTHLDRPLALLENQTTSEGRWLWVDLIGTRSERDAIGANVVVEAAGQKWMHQRIAGCGFETSNESFLPFSLGDAMQVDRLTITWPSGQTQVLNNLGTNQRITVVEGE